MNLSQVILVNGKLDTVFFLDGTERSMHNAFDNLDCFPNMSRLRVDVEKTSAVWIGSKNTLRIDLCGDINVHVPPCSVQHPCFLSLSHFMAKFNVLTNFIEYPAIESRLRIVICWRIITRISPSCSLQHPHSPVR